MAADAGVDWLALSSVPDLVKLAFELRGGLMLRSASVPGPATGALCLARVALGRAIAGPTAPGRVGVGSVSGGVVLPGRRWGQHLALPVRELARGWVVMGRGHRKPNPFGGCGFARYWA